MLGLRVQGVKSQEIALRPQGWGFKVWVGSEIHGICGCLHYGGIWPLAGRNFLQTESEDGQRNAMTHRQLWA